MIGLGSAVREERYWTDAQAVAVETMKRACENVDRLVLKLEALGYDFVGASKAGDQLTSPVGGTFTATERDRGTSVRGLRRQRILRKLKHISVGCHCRFERGTKSLGPSFFAATIRISVRSSGIVWGKNSSVFPDPMCFFSPDVEFPLSEFLKYRTPDADGRYSFPIAPEPKIKSARSGSVFYVVKLLNRGLMRC
jgi:hypothetical protein